MFYRMGATALLVLALSMAGVIGCSKNAGSGDSSTIPSKVGTDIQ